MKRILTGFLLVFLFLSQSYGQQTAANFTFDVVCDGQTTTLTSTSTVLPGDSIILYLWDTTWSDGVLNPVNGFGPNVTVHFPGPGVYDIGLKIYTKFNLMESIYKQVAVTNVVADFSAANFCFGDATQFTDNSMVENASITSWMWSFGDAGASNVQNASHTYLNSGTFSVNLQVTTVNGCTANVTKPIDIHSLPVISVDYSMTPFDVINNVPQFSFYEDQSMIASVNIEGAFSNITWLPTWENTPTITIDQTGNYSVHVTSDLGCISVVDFVVTVLEDKLVQPIPVMTPNGDGSNDVFKIKRYIMPDDRYNLTIFNRYGNEVYSDANYQNDWNGEYKGNLVPEGPYYYFLKDKDGQEWKGPVNVVYNK